MNSSAYIKTVIDWPRMNADWGGVYRLVSQRSYKGKPGLPAGVMVRLQIIEDHAEPRIDKKTGRPLDNNVFETFEATIPGTPYPLAFKKGDYVSLDGFMPDASYYIDYNLILRFESIKAAQPPKPQTQTPKGSTD